MISTEQAINGFVRFLDKEMMTKLPGDGLQKVAVGVVSALAVRKGTTAIEKLKTHPLALAFEIFDSNGNVDIDLLRDVVKTNIPDTGVKIKVPVIGGMTAFKEDVDSLYRYISEAGEIQ